MPKKSADNESKNEMRDLLRLALRQKAKANGLQWFALRLQEHCPNRRRGADDLFTGITDLQIMRVLASEPLPVELD